MKNVKWFLECIVILLISIFLHECGHGLANAILGIDCSTGFNRVGDIYKYPSDPLFREEYSEAGDYLLDFGVPMTLILAVSGTAVFCKSKNEKVRNIAGVTGAVNSILRLVPAGMVVLIPLFTGNAHAEDELDTGRALVNLSGSSLWLYIPALISVAISIVCIALLIKKAGQKSKTGRIIGFGILTYVAFDTSIIIANILDNIIRINWRGM